MTNYGIKMSKPGVDVKTAADVDLSWSSDFRTLKLYRVIVFTGPGSVTHGLDYPPTFTALMRVGGVTMPTCLGYQELAYSFVSVDDEKVYTTNPSSLHTLPYPVNWDRVYVSLFIDPLNE
jgi:hypothetical protein